MVDIKLNQADIDKLRKVTCSDQTEGVTSALNEWIRQRVAIQDTQMAYTGRRLRTKDDIHLLMYKSELKVS